MNTLLQRNEFKERKHYVMQTLETQTRSPQLQHFDETFNLKPM